MYIKIIDIKIEHINIRKWGFIRFKLLPILHFFWIFLIFCTFNITELFNGANFNLSVSLSTTT